MLTNWRNSLLAFGPLAKSQKPEALYFEAALSTRGGCGGAAPGGSPFVMK
jgi:hypothetical protein